MLVKEAMTERVVTCHANVSLRTAAGRMLRNDVGSVIVRDDETPVGMVTETDALRAGFAADVAFSEIPVSKVMNRPLVTITKDKTLRRATERMEEENIKKLPVVEDFDLVGVLTAHDVIEHYHDLRKEISTVTRPGATRPTESERFSFEDL
ncbi:CBS domain protein [Natronomonas pharaonis DSM 2160]|uniref:CBS domain protein n=1 Tax=Natronomonas pharaonis (strain ATCC 35678 / DSM 2160 / CIP 103997 / JCM 8858 / NBRC 14720 / NCIMB 2260 / Gabara) TaxID=348780 RepID=A0A1U7EX92_NATPD|nr:CBS domain-containing protein [Natronomonas pharaonis]CAI49788.1 CBS domain protein [Natronomonas pharaonis DSM 2160]